MKKLTFWKSLFLLCALIVGSTSAWGQDEVTLWSENFSGYSADNVPSGGDFSYVCQDGKSKASSTSATKIYGEALAGGSSPELLIGKGPYQYGFFQATITDFKGCTGTLTLSFKENKGKNVALSTSTANVTIGDVSRSEQTTGYIDTYTITIPDGITSLVLKIASTGSDNIRVDDIILKGTKATVVTTHKLTFSATNGSIYAVDADDNEVASEADVAEGAELTVTANPAAGYKFKQWSVSGTGSSVGSVTTNPTTFTMGTADATLTAVFEEDNTDYTITLTPTTGGTIEASSSTAKNGTEITLTPTPDSGYRFVSWDVKDASNNEVVVTNNKFTMPASDVTVTATFKQQFTVTYYVADQSAEVNRIEDESLNLPSPSAIGGMEFVGWSSSNNIANPVFVSNTSAVTSNMTLYAIFAEDVEAAKYTLVESNLTDWRGDYLLAYGDDYFADGRKAGDDGFSKANGTVDPDDALENDEVTAEWGDTYNITLEAVDDDDLTKGYVIKTKDGKYSYYGSYGNGCTSTENKSTAANHYLTLSVAGNKDITITANSYTNNDQPATLALRFNDGNNQNRFRFYKSGQQPVYLYKRQAGAAIYSLGTQKSINVTDAKYATYVTPANIDFASSESVTAYKVTAVTTSKITMESIDAAPKGTPVVIKTNAQGDYNLAYATSAPAAITDNLLQAGPVTGDGASYYVLGKDASNKLGFGLLKAGVELPATKAYLPVSAVGARVAFIPFDSETTAIDFVIAEPIDANAPMYNLAGQRVNKSYKGVVIVNGKKMLNK